LFLPGSALHARQDLADSLRNRIVRERLAEQERTDQSLTRLDALLEQTRNTLKEFKGAVCQDKRFVEGGMDSIQRELNESLAELSDAFTDQRGSLTDFARTYDSLYMDLMEDEDADSEEYVDLFNDTKNTIMELRKEVDTNFAQQLDEMLNAMKSSLSLIVESYVEEFPAGGPHQQSSDPPAAPATGAASLISIGLGYSSTYSYLGRTSSTKQAALTPSLMYLHSSGLYAIAAINWLSRQTPHVNEFDFGVGYTLDLSDHLEASIGFTRMIYKDSSFKFTRTIQLSDKNVTLSYQENPQNKIDLGFEYSIVSIAEISWTGEYLFGGGQDFDMSFGVKHRHKYSKILFGADLSFDPALTMAFSASNRYKLSKKSAALAYAVEKKIVGIEIADYQLVLPVTCTMGGFSVAPALNLDLPQNEAKKVSGYQFLSFTFSMAYTF
jgi:hypothetical protein